jgi:asparagine synthase (glutamine-hydrolysing)
MCGIAGLVYTDPARPCEPDLVLAMRDVATYRGPDDAGLYVEGPVGLGHRRLSIIDLGGGHQPMSDPRGAFWIVFNGEIYNYREIRASLLTKGYTFQTNSDTEVIVQLYADRGERCVDVMNGMFAFAIWDRERHTLFLARDRMGVKPLYYAETKDAFLFGSEIKSIFASGKVEPSCRREALAEYLLFRQVAGPEGLFRSIRSVPPGCTMTVRSGAATVTRYWSPRPAPERAPIAFNEAHETLAGLLEDSVRMRLVSDVPVGTFCSGGVDSSLVTALAAKAKGDTINTFSVAFDEPDYDESAYARMVARHCGTTHHQLKVDNVAYSDLFPKMVWHNDEPLDFANSVQIFALSRLAKEYVTVVLTGEGSDELFGGYPRYRLPGLARAFRLLPARLRRGLVSAVCDHRVEKLDRFASLTAEDAILFNSSYTRPDRAVTLAPCLPSFDAGFRRSCLDASRPLSLEPAARASLLDQETFLVSILHRQDKMSMAASIESRVPFMDYRIVEFANRLPIDCKIRRGTGKALVKTVARRLLPAAVVDRRKSGFGVPLDRWFRSNVGMGERIAGLPASRTLDPFDRPVLSRLVAEHRSGTRDHTELLWAALNVCTWREAFGC